MSDRDQDGIPDAEQLTIEEIETVDRHAAEGVLEMAKERANRAPKPGIQADEGFTPDDYEYDGTMRVIVLKHRRTGKRVQVNYTKLVRERLIEIREGHSIEGGVQGARAAALSGSVISKLGKFGPFLTAILAGGGSVPGLLVNAGLEVLGKAVKGKKGSALVEAIRGGGKILLVLLALASAASATLAQHPISQGSDSRFPPPLILYHDMLVSQVGIKEPSARLAYISGGLEFRVRKSILVGWTDAVLTARFERNGDRVQLIAQSLTAGILGDQRGKNFERARAGLLKLVDVKDPATRVEIREGDVVHSLLVYDSKETR